MISSSSTPNLAVSPDLRAAEREQAEQNPQTSKLLGFSSTTSHSLSKDHSASSSRADPLSDSSNSPHSVKASLRAHTDGHEELDSDARKSISSASLRSQPKTIEAAKKEEEEQEEDHSTDPSHLACYFLAGGAAGATSRTVWLRDSEGELTVVRRLAAGGFAGIASVVSTYPLDLVRSRISIASASLYEEVKQSTTTTTASTASPASTMSTSTTTTTTISSKSTPTPRNPIKLTPAELRAEIEAKQKMVPGIWKMTVKVYREEGGVRGLYRGCVPTSAGVMPYVSLNFIGYEYLRKRYARWTGEFELDSHGHQIDHISAMGKLACGALAGSFSQTLTYPLDVLRRRMQVAGMKDSNLGYHDKNSFDCIRTIMRAEGFKGLYRGLLPNLLKVAPSIGTSFCTYEVVRDGLERYFASYNQPSPDTKHHD